MRLDLEDDNMKLTKEQVKQIIQNAPQGTKPGDIVQGLVSRGYELEGYNDNQPNSAIPQSSLLGMEQEQPQKKSVGGFLGNVVNSGFNFVKNTAEAVIHPIRTVKSLGKVGLGAAEKVVPGRQGAETEFDAVTDFFKQRYGTWEKAKETAYNDPVGVASDLATLFTGAGGALKLAKVAKVGSVVSRAGDIVNPLTAVTEAGKALIPKTALSNAARKFYQSAAKFSNRSNLSEAQKTELALTGLREGIPVTKAGLDKLENNIDALNGQIAAKIDAAAEAGHQISKQAVVGYLKDVKDFYRKSLYPEHYAKMIDELEQKFIKSHGDTDLIDIGTAQKIKQNTYAIHRKHYGEMKGIEVETEKALARGIKEEIVNQFPEVGELNSQESALLKLEPIIERAVGRITNKDLIGLGDEVAGVAGTVAAGPGGGIIAALTRKILDDPGVKSKIAIILQKVADKKTVQPGRIRRVILPTGRLLEASKQ